MVTDIRCLMRMNLSDAFSLTVIMLIFVEGSLYAESGLRALRNMTSRMFLLSLFPGEGTDSGYELA